MPLVAEGWETVWASHWPINNCTADDSGVHRMRVTGLLAQCEGCYKFFSNEDADAYFKKMQELVEFATDRHRQN